jgi:putative Holliday junction resolvase
LARILAIDYGQKRVGLAVTDPTGLIANNLETVHSKDIWQFLNDYLNREDVETIVVGYPLRMNNEPSDAIRFINPFIKKLQNNYPGINVTTVDERFTSKMAFQAMIDGGLKRKARRNKEMVDKISANLILQSYLEEKSNH